MIKNDPVLKELTKSFKILKSPNRWIKGHFRKKHAIGEAYCLLGSLGFRKVPEGHYGHKERLPKLKAALYMAKAIAPRDYYNDTLMFDNVALFNDGDSTKHKKVVSVIKKAIALRKKDIKSKKEGVWVPRGVKKYNPSWSLKF